MPPMTEASDDAMDESQDNFRTFEERAREVAASRQPDGKALREFFALLLEAQDIQISLLCDIADSLDLRTVKKS